VQIMEVVQQSPISKGYEHYIRIRNRSEMTRLKDQPFKRRCCFCAGINLHYQILEKK
jgi:hypothetical protein